MDYSSWELWLNRHCWTDDPSVRLLPSSEGEDQGLVEHSYLALLYWSRPASATIARTGLLRLRTEILFSAMLLSSFFPEGIPFLPIEPNGLARNCIPPIPSLLEENDTENTIHKKRAIPLETEKIPSASENILLLFGRTQASKAYCPESGPMLLCSGWSTFWHCWFHLSIVRASPIPCWSSAALVLFPFLWSSAARSKSGEPCAQKPSFFSFEARSLIGWSSSCCSVKCRHVNHAYSL